MNPSRPRPFRGAWLPILSSTGWLFACAVAVDESREEEVGTRSDGIGVRLIDPTSAPASIATPGAAAAPAGPAAAPAAPAAPTPQEQARAANARDWGVNKVAWFFGVECGLAGTWPARYNECCHKYPEGWGVGGVGQTKCAEFCERMYFTPNEEKACCDGCMAEFTQKCQSTNGG
jgi:hypothetical protein